MPAWNIRCRFGAAAAAAAFATTLFAPAAAPAAGRCANADATPDQISVSQARRSTLCLLNRIRRAHHLRKFRANHSLSLASQRHADEMAVHHYFAHGDFVGRIKSAHYLSHTRGWTLGENIAWGTYEYSTPASIVQGWMHSPPHRANILNRSFREIGLGISRGVPVTGQGSGGTYVTDFGARY